MFKIRECFLFFLHTNETLSLQKCNNKASLLQQRKKRHTVKKFFEKIIQGMLTVSGFVTSIIILLIVLFLFTEGAGLFTKPKVEDGYEIVINKKNAVKRLLFNTLILVWKLTLSWTLSGPEDRVVYVEQCH